MSDEQVEGFLKKFDEADTNNSGKLGLSEFIAFFPEIIPGQNDEAARTYFRGIDINGDGTVAKDEFRAFVVAALTKDKTYTLKLVFRAFDVNRNNLLEVGEIKQIGQYVGAELDDAAIEEGIERIGGQGKTGLNFAQVVKLLLDIDIAEDTDPYDGRLKKPAGDAPTPAEPAAATPAAGDAPAGKADPAQPAAKPEEKKSGCCLLL
jgi:Ca2+-binding EF-hand superfamily protein